MRAIRRVLCLLALLVLAAPLARADDFTLPGVEEASDAYASALTGRYPNGGTPQARKAAELSAATAAQKKDWGAAVVALEQRVALGNATRQNWHDLATALLRRSPPDGQKALDAAWQEFSGADTGEQEISGLLLIADALRALSRPTQVIETLQAVVERAPGNPGYAKMLADARRTIGMLVTRVRPEPEADPPRACIEFSVPPTRKSDFTPQDWVRFDPPLPDAAVTHEGDALCLSGLPSGTTTHVVLRSGLPGEDGINLTKDTPVALAVANRKPSIITDSRLFVLPRGQQRSLTLTTVNISTVSLKLLRLSERTVADFLRTAKLGEPVEAYAADRLAYETAPVVWSGRAEIAGKQNRTTRTALPLPDALTASGPGLYALQISADDGSPNVESAPVQMILRTDLAPTVWRGTDGLTVQMRSYADARIVPGVKLRLLARGNEILGETQSDADGVARFAAPLLHGEGPMAPGALQAFGADGDFATLDLNAASFDLSDRGVEGAPYPGKLDAFVWLDRGIYRPGETVQAMALLRDDEGAPVDLPATVVVKRPNGLVFSKTAPPRLGDASLHVPVTLSASAQSGMWTVEVRADPEGPAIGSAQFRVDAFVPDRMAVDLGPAPRVLVPGQAAALPVAVRYLYGAPGAGLSGKGHLRLMLDPAAPAGLVGYRVGLADEPFAPDTQDLDLPDTDGQGRSSLPVKIDQAPDTTHPVRAEIDVEVNDPSGRAVRASTTIPVRSVNPSIGIKPAFADDAVDANAEAAFDIIAADPDGRRLAMPARLRLVRERPDWRFVFSGERPHFEITYVDEPLVTQDLTLGTDAPLHFARRLDWGRYRLEVLQTGGLAGTSVRFRSGWTESDTPDVPDRVDVSVDRRSVPVGQSARIHIAAPFAGEATVAVLTGRVVSYQDITVTEGGTDVDVPVQTAWGPGAYVAVHVFRGGDKPRRALGLTWVGVDPAARKLDVAIDAADKYVPRAPASFTVRTAPGAWVTLAAVDEGILRLTDFKSPDPVPHFLGQRVMGVDIRDDWGRLIAPADGEATALKQGGDEGAAALPEIPQHTLILFAAPVQADADGRAMIPLDLPDFAGQVRLMAVAWQGNRIGSAATDALVRDALVAEPLLPRFLAPGDETRLSVLLHNLDLPSGQTHVAITTEGPVSLSGPHDLVASLATGQQAVPVTTLRATGAGRGVIHLAVTGPGGFSVRHEAAILVRPARAPVTNVAGGQLPAGADATLAASADGFVPGTWRATATFGLPVRYDVAGMVRGLSDYPLSCLEQATSRGLPLAVLPDGDLAGQDRAGRLQASVNQVLDKQRSDGGFGLWGPTGEAEPWLSAYAMEFLLRARAAGAVVGDQAVIDGLHHLDEALTDSDRPAEQVAQAYRVYVLALSGQGRPGAARVLAEHIDDLPTPLAKAQVGAALALAHDTARAEAAFAAALASPDRHFKWWWWDADYGTALRDQLAIAVLLKESGLLPDRMAQLLSALPGADLAPAGMSTQEQAWAATAAGVLGRTGQPAHVLVGGVDRSGPTLTVALTGPTPVRNLGTQPVWRSVSQSGVSTVAAPASRAGMRVSRHFYNTDGSNLDLDHLKQNTVFVLLVEGQAEDHQDHMAQLLQGLPAGWEIVGRMAAGPVAGMSWLGELTETQAQPAADDRFAAVIQVMEDKPSFRVAIRLRAVTPGDYELPGADLSDMYRPGVYARQTANRIKVLAPE